MKLHRQILKITTALALPALLATGAIAQSTSYNSAFEAYNNQDYDTAIPIWQELANDGNADAQYALGVAYFKGEGVPRELMESMKWFERAAKSGNVNAMFNLGAAYWEGKGTRQSYAEAVEWWEKSAAEGQSASQYNLGLAYYLGKGAEKDLDKAIEWIRLAAKNDHAGATHLLPVIENELPKNAPPEITTENHDEKPTKIEPPSSIGKTDLIGANYRSAIVSGHGGQAYPKQDSGATVLADLAAGTPVKVLSSRDGWAAVNVPAVASVWVYGKYVVTLNSNSYIRGTRVRARSLPSTSSDSVIVGAFDANERVQILTERGDWKQVSAPPKFPLWMPIEQLEVYPQVTSGWLEQWNQATSGPSAIAVTSAAVPESLATDSKVTDNRPNQARDSNVTGNSGPTESFQPALVSVANAEVLVVDRNDASVLELVRHNSPVKVIAKRGKWSRVRLPTPITIWVYSRYVAQNGDTAAIKGTQVRARSMPATTRQSFVLGLLEDGTAVTVISKEGDWIRVSVLDEIAVWMRTDQLQIMDQETDDWRTRWKAAREAR